MHCMTILTSKGRVAHSQSKREREHYSVDMITCTYQCVVDRHCLQVAVELLSPLLRRLQLVHLEQLVCPQHSTTQLHTQSNYLISLCLIYLIFYIFVSKDSLVLWAASLINFLLLYLFFASNHYFSDYLCCFMMWLSKFEINTLHLISQSFIKAQRNISIRFSCYLLMDHIVGSHVGTH